VYTLNLKKKQETIFLNLQLFVPILTLASSMKLLEQQIPLSVVSAHGEFPSLPFRGQLLAYQAGPLFSLVSREDFCLCSCYSLKL